MATLTCPAGPRPTVKKKCGGCGKTKVHGSFFVKKDQHMRTAFQCRDCEKARHDRIKAQAKQATKTAPAKDAKAAPKAAKASKTLAKAK